MEDSFELSEFAAALLHQAPEALPKSLSAELARVRAMTIRDASKRFNQQKYLKGLERLSRALNGEDVSKELTPSEKQVHSMLEVVMPGPHAQSANASVASAAVSAPVAMAAPAAAPAAVPAETPEPVLTGAERRTSRRIQMKTKVRVRRESDNVSEILEPLNVSRGGIGFQSPKRFALHETVFITMHYMPGTSEMETKSMIVRAAPIANSTNISYGVKFL